MCRIFSGQDPSNYDSETRSVRIGGHVTSIRLEKLFWQTLEELASSQTMTMPQFISKLHDEVLELRGDLKNFSSLLRCCCLIYLSNSGAKPGIAATASASNQYIRELAPALVL
jgi:predicted DNA-binding ribbon-helix-helix protein